MSEWNHRVLRVKRWEVTSWRTRPRRWIIPEGWQATARGYDEKDEQVVMVGVMFTFYTAHTREDAKAKVHAAIREAIAGAEAEREFQRAEAVEFSP